MKRFLKISRLLKIAQESNNAVWQTVLAEAQSEELPTEYTGIKANVEASASKAMALKDDAVDAKDKVGNEPIPDDVRKTINELLNNPQALREAVELSRSGVSRASILDDSSIAISKRAGIFGSIWSTIKGGFKAVFHYFPFIGVVWALYEAYHDFEEVRKSSVTIRSNFSDLGNEEQLFDAEYISSIIDKHRDDADKMLEVIKLNKVARFYSENFYMVWADVAWFISDLIGSILIIGAAVGTGGVALGVGGAATLILGRISLALGLGSAAASISVGIFDTMLGKFDDNKTRIIEIAKDHVGFMFFGEESSMEDSIGDT